MPGWFASLSLSDCGPEERVVRVAATVIAYGGADGFRHFVEARDQLFNVLFAKRISLESLVQICDICRMMLVMMNFHRFGIDVRLKSVKCIGKRGKLVRHNKYLLSERIGAVKNLNIG